MLSVRSVPKSFFNKRKLPLFYVHVRFDPVECVLTLDGWSPWEDAIGHAHIANIIQVLWKMTERSTQLHSSALHRFGVLLIVHIVR